MKPRTVEPETCFFCGSTHVLVPEVGIAFDLGGNDFSFCKKCLQSMTAEEFWKRMFKEFGKAWPPKLLKESRNRG